MTNQRRYTIRCLLTSNMTHTNCWLYLMYCHIWYLSYLQDVTVQLPGTELKTHTCCCYITMCFLLVLDRCWFQFHTSAALSPGPIEYYDRNSAGGTANRFGLEGPGITSRCVRNFPQQSRQALRPNQPLTTWVSSLSPGKTPGALRWQPIPIRRRG